MTADHEPMLIAAARQGDREALQCLLTQNWGWLRGLVYGIVADRDILDDVMQDVCLRVITGIRTLRDPQRFRGWLATVARREALRYRRRRTPHAREWVDVTACDRPQEHGSDPALSLERRELCGRVLEAVNALPPKYREVFVLAHSGELTYAQMAEVLGVPITTMQIRLVRARRMIRDQIVRDGEQRVVEHERGR